MYGAMLEMIVAESYAKSPTFSTCSPNEFQAQTRYFKNDLRAIINHNIDDISGDMHHRSNMLAKLD
jgi:hypothetical protein